MLEEFKLILKEHKLKGVDFHKYLGMGYGGYRSATAKGRIKKPLWIRAFILGYRLRGGAVLTDENTKDLK